jgi:hypothetical protein
MGLYPTALLPHHTYPASLPGEEILDCFFVRETKEDLYPLFGSGFDSDDLIRKIIVSPTPKRDVFEFSIFLYGYYHEDHFGIRASDNSLNTEPVPKLIDYALKRATFGCLGFGTASGSFSGF